MQDEEDAEEEFRPPPSKTAKSDTGKRVSKLKFNKRVVESEEDEDVRMDVDPVPEVLSEPEEPPVSKPKPRSTTSARGKNVDRGNSVQPQLRTQSQPTSSNSRSHTQAQEEKVNPRKSSTTSDDAGYATAEVPMEVDEEEDDGYDDDESDATQLEQILQAEANAPLRPIDDEMFKLSCAAIALSLDDIVHL